MMTMMMMLVSLLLLLLSCRCDFNRYSAASFHPSTRRIWNDVPLRQLPSPKPSSSRFSEAWKRSSGGRRSTRRRCDLECNRRHRLTRDANMNDWKLSAVAAEGSRSSTNEQQGELLSTSGPPAITARDLTCTFDGGNTFQLRAANYDLPRGRRVGLVGRNGCGKSTFLRILAEACGNDGASGASRSGFDLNNDHILFTGTVECPKGVSLAFVEQEPPSPSDVTVLDALLGIITTTTTTTNNGGSRSTNAVSSTSSSTTKTSAAAAGGKNSNAVYETVRRYRLASLHAETNPNNFAIATSEMDDKGGWSVLTKAEEISTRLRVRHLEPQPLSSLSGGERKRVALAAALVREPDVLILDEPTNHLDLAAIRWLTDLITSQRSSKLTLLTVTHDRAFLEDVCDTILELDRGQFYAYDGTYSTYLQGKEERLANEDQAYRVAKGRYKNELDWMRKQPQARQTKQKARIDAFYKLEQSTKPRVKDPSLELLGGDDSQRRLGGNILKLRNVSLSFGTNKCILNDFSYDFNKGDRIGIVGRNGVGKSTFINILTGEQNVDSGAIDMGETVVFGKYAQMGITFLNDAQTVLDYVKERVESSSGTSMAESPAEAMRLLKQFEFPRPRWNERVSMLSGGEKRRLQLLSVLTRRPNFLILDEPTNDVDLDTLRALEGYLEEFNGVLVVVSHDRLFTDKVTNHLFVFEGNGIVKDYLGSLSDYAECLVEQENIEEAAAGGGSSGAIVDGDSRKGLYKEDKEKRLERRNSIKKMKRDIDKIEPVLEKLRAKVIVLQMEIDTSSEKGWTVLADLTDKLQKVNDEIDVKEMEWLELSEVLEGLEVEEESNLSQYNKQII